MSRLSSPGPGDTPPDCAVCGERTHWYSARLCERCKKLRDRFDFRSKPDKEEWERALRESWDGDARVFRCAVTGVALVHGREHWPHPRYLDREHLTPGDHTAYAACASLINSMKGSMSQLEFEQAVLELAGLLEADMTGSPRATELAQRLKGSAPPSALPQLVNALAVRLRGGEFDASVFQLE